MEMYHALPPHTCEIVAGNALPYCRHSSACTAQVMLNNNCNLLWGTMCMASPHHRDMRGAFHFYPPPCMHTVCYAGVRKLAQGECDVYLAASRQRLKRGLLYFDVQQAQRVEAPLPVGSYARVEAIRPPAVREEHYGYRLQRAGTSGPVLVAATVFHSTEGVLLEEVHPQPTHRSCDSSTVSKLLASLPTSHIFVLWQ